MLLQDNIRSIMRSSMRREVEDKVEVEAKDKVEVKVKVEVEVKDEALSKAG